MDQRPIESWALNPLMDQFVGNSRPFCPYCNHQFDKMPGRKRSCPGCGKIVYKRTRPQDDEHIVIRDEDREILEEQWAIKNGEHEQYLSQKKQRDGIELDLMQSNVTPQADMTIFVFAGVYNAILARKITMIVSGWHNKGFHEFRRQCLAHLSPCPHDTQLEFLFRNLVRPNYCFDSEKSVSQYPLADNMFPYVEISPIDDGRTTNEHKLMATQGLDGTGVYRRDDPVYLKFKPPWGTTCRCSYTLLTVEIAARKQVTEAREWNQTGRSPESPEWVPHPPFEPTAIPCEIMGVPGEIPYLKKLLENGDQIEAEWVTDLLDAIADLPVIT